MKLFLYIGAILLCFSALFLGCNANNDDNNDAAGNTAGDTAGQTDEGGAENAADVDPADDGAEPADGAGGNETDTAGAETEGETAEGDKKDGALSSMKNSYLLLLIPLAGRIFV